MDALDIIQYLIRHNLKTKAGEDIKAIDVDQLDIMDLSAANNKSIELHKTAKQYVDACSKTRYALSSFIENMNSYRSYVNINQNIARSKIEELQKMRIYDKDQLDVFGVEPFIFV